MIADFVETPGTLGLRATVQFADWDRPAVGGNSLGLFACVWAGGARPDVRELQLVDGAQVLARIAPLHTTAEVLATLCPGNEERAVFGHLCVNRLLLRTAGVVSLVAVNAEGNSQAVGEIHYSDNAGFERHDLGLRPILVTSMGRSGSTILANALGLHRSVAAIGGYPFEYRFFSYCLHAAYVLTSPAAHAASMGADSFENRHPFGIGFNPFNHRDFDTALGGDALRDWYEGPYAREAVRFFMERARDAVAIAAAGKPGAFAFVEKMGGSLLANVAHHVCEGVREVVLVRGFWDVARSMIAFDAKRGTENFFAREDRQNADRWLASLAGRQRHIVERSRLPGMIAVSYEALVADPRTELRRLLEALQLDAEPNAIDPMIAAFGTQAYSRAHSTRDGTTPVELERLFSEQALAEARAALEETETA